MLDRFAALGRWQRLGLAFISGALLTAGHPPVNFPWTWFLALPVLGLLTLAAPSARSVAWIGWAAGFGYFVSALHWVGHAFIVDPDKILLMPLGVAALPAGLAMFWALAFWVARRFGPTAPLARIATVSGTLTAVEIARTHVLTGFPWALPGYIWVETPVMQMVAWTGPHGMTLATFLITGLPGIALVTRQARWTVPLICIAVLSGAWVAGATRLSGIADVDNDRPLLRIVQPNAPQHLKWKPGHREEFYRRGIDATKAPRVRGPLDAVIWPETAIFFLPENNPEEIRALAGLAEAPLIAGAMAVEGTAEDETWYNSLFVYAPDGELLLRYDKHHLVPFGEFIPLPWLANMLGLEKFGIGGGFGRGKGPETIKIPGLPTFSALICYEAIFPHNIIADGPRPDWLLQITNDAWFGNFAGPQQHLAQARIRAIEQGLPMVRAANTGISAMIDGHGRILRSLPLGEFGHFDARLPNALEPTVYARTGDWPGYGVLTLLLAGTLLFGRRQPF
ncbi:MAG: apolipoprotein N-acyltransferase [Paracoccaceae bacterium]